MKRKHKTSKNVVRKTMTALLLFFLILNGLHILFNETVTIISIASSENIAWESTIRITESGGRGDDVVFGEATNASDGQDEYDKIKPPFPPQLPYLLIRFDASLDSPYDQLWYEYKQYPDDHKIWNFSILWMNEPGNETSTTISISWNTTEIDDSEYTSLLLYENNTVVADMLTESGYTFDLPSETFHHFQIICQSETSNNKTSFLSFIVVLLTIVLFTLYLKKNK